MVAYRTEQHDLLYYTFYKHFLQEEHIPDHARYHGYTILEEEKRILVASTFVACYQDSFLSEAPQVLLSQYTIMPV